jgi:hypothetical protein
MVVWYKVKWIDPLFAACNGIAPNRTHAQDGAIGDLAHAQGTSGHNPDDTAGVSAERQDADTKPEVRAADVDARFNQPGITMEMVVQATVAECRAGRERRFIYIIFNRRIWSASSGWAERAYTGDDPHDKHAHFSGHPDHDENGAPFPYITALAEDDMELTDRVGNTQTPAATNGRNVDQVLGDLENERNIGRGEIGPTDGRYPAAGTPARAALGVPANVQAIIATQADHTAMLDGLQDSVAEIQAGQVSQEVVTAALLAALRDPGVQAILISAAEAGSNRAEDS